MWRELHEIEGKVPGLIEIENEGDTSPEQMERGYLMALQLIAEDGRRLKAAIRLTPIIESLAHGWWPMP